MRSDDIECGTVKVWPDAGKRLGLGAMLPMKRLAGARSPSCASGAGSWSRSWR